MITTKLLVLVFLVISLYLVYKITRWIKSIVFRITARIAAILSFIFALSRLYLLLS